MARIAVIVTDMFEDDEYVEPVRAMESAGHQVANIGLEAGVKVYGKNRKTATSIDRSVADAEPDEFDALLIPGGYSPDRLRADENAVTFVRRFMAQDKPVFSICHAPQLLISADVLRGRTITGWKSVVQDIKNAGATFVDREVVEDGNLISSRSPADLPAFIRTLLARLADLRPQDNRSP
ncbi:MAG: type 1 glutamine amidotransferase domain-containing protein [Thermodesulfobacteriota bacterium]